MMWGCFGCGILGMAVLADLVPAMDDGIHLDVIHFRAGGSVQGSIDHVDADGDGEGSVRFKVIMDGPSGRGEAVRQVSLADIAFIDFAQSDVERAIVAGSPRDSEVKAVSSATIRRLWKRDQPNMHLPNSPGGGLGLALVERLLSSGRTARALEARAIAEEIVERDWDEDRRRRAALYKLKAMVVAGRAGDAEDEATTLLVSAEDDPALTVEARLVLGHAAVQRLRELVEQHPRWIDDREIRPQCASLIRTALDHLLYGSLFHGALREPAAEGLWQACEMYRLIEKQEKARAVARDLIELYPGTDACEKAQHWIEEAPQE